MTDAPFEPLQPIAVRDLPQHLGLSRSRVFTLLSDLEIQRVEIDGVTSITGESLALVESAVRHTKSGGTVLGFRQQNGLAPLEVTEAPEPTLAEVLQPILGAVAAVLDRLEQKAIAPADAGDLERIRLRTEVLRLHLETGLALPNSEAAALLGVTAESLRRRPSAFVAFGVQFQRRQHGRSVEWAVLPIQSTDVDTVD